jgi:uncharacterized protein
MAIHIEERFVVRAPAQPVWDHLLDPRRVVTCLPGAELAAVVDERTFDGNVKVKVGTITVTYRGRVHLAQVDVAARRVRMTAQGRESGGAGQARVTMDSEVSALPDGGTEVVIRAQLDVAGRIVQLGRGMIEQVSHQLFEQFAACVQATVEVAEATGAAAPGTAAPSAAPLAPGSAEAVRALPLLFRALWAWLLGLLGRRPGRRA